MSETSEGVYRIPHNLPMPPTRQCLICEALENKEADVVIVSGAAWLCQECKCRLKQMLYSREGE